MDGGDRNRAYLNRIVSFVMSIGSFARITDVTSKTDYLSYDHD